MEAYDHWYRAINDGWSKLDTIPYVNRMNAYKEWMEEIEDRALDTLKQAINQLLITFEEKDNIKTYKKTKGSTKREQIEELMSLLT